MINAELTVMRIVFRRNNGKPILLCSRGEFFLSHFHPVEFGIEGNLHQKKLLQRAGDPVGIDFGRTKRIGKEAVIIGIGGKFPDEIIQRFVHLDLVF